MANLSGQTIINEVDIFDTYGAFLSELNSGSRENAKAIFTPSATKEHVAVDFRERTGEKYALELLQVNQARDVTLTFCIYASSKAQWLSQYLAFVAFLKKGDKGWLAINFPSVNFEMRVFYKSCSQYAPLSYIWREGKQASHFQVVFREPEPKL